nr:hypothetical protein [Tanacetum cinerariifolium]
MSTQQDIYAAGSESHPPMLNKENYVSWSSCLLRYDKSDAERDVNVNETFHEQTDDELSEKELKQIEADDQAIQTILLGLPEDIYASPEWSRHVTIVHQTKDLHIVDYTQLYDFLKYNQKEVNELKVKRLAKIQDPLALMVNSINPYASPAPHQDVSPFNHNYLQKPMTNPEDITDPTTAMNMALSLMGKAFKLNYSTPTNNNQRISSNPRNRQIAQPGMNMGQDRQIRMIRSNDGNQFRQYAGNLNGYNAVQNVGNQVAQNPRVQNVGNQNGPIGVQGNENQNQIGNGIQLQAQEYDLMAAAVDLDEIKEVNANCILMANLQQATSSGTQTDSAPVYDSDGSAEDDNEVISEDTGVEQGGEIVE